MTHLTEIAAALFFIPVALLSVAAMMPARWVLGKLVLLIVATGAVYGIVGGVLGHAREQGAAARETRDAMAAALREAAVRHDDAASDEGGFDPGLVLADLASSGLEDQWGHAVQFEVRDGTVVAWSLGWDAKKQDSGVPAHCHDRARPDQDIILELRQSGEVQWLQAPGRGEIGCTRAPDVPMPRYLWAIYLSQLGVTSAALFKLWRGFQAARSSRLGASR